MITSAPGRVWRCWPTTAPHNSGPDFGKASPFGLLVVVLLLISVLFLVRSMNRHLKKLPESFDPQHPEPDQAVDDGHRGGCRGAGIRPPTPVNGSAHAPGSAGDPLRATPMSSGG